MLFIQVKGEQMSNDFEIKADEYLGKDGLIFCKHCNTPRTWISDDGAFKVRCLCKCQKSKQQELEKQRQAALAFEKIKSLKELSLLGRRYANSSFENLDMNRPQSFVKAVNRCKAYCNNWKIVKSQGYGMYIFGSVGTGKTELVACICNQLIQNLVPVIITNFLEISKKLRESYNREIETENQIIDKLAKIDLLVLDDIGSEKLFKNNGESFMQEKIYDIVNRRYINNMPTIFTSNYSIQQLIDERGLEIRTADRIAEMSNAVMKLDGSSYREIKILKEKKNESNSTNLYSGTNNKVEK